MKKYIIPGIIVVLALVAFYVSKTKGDTSTLNDEQSDFAVQDTAAVTKIVIKHKGEGEVKLERIDGANWRLNDTYYARPDAIQLLLKTFNRIAVESPVNEATTETVVRNMASTGKEVEIYTNGQSEPLKIYHLGISVHDQLGNYMILEQNGEIAKNAFITHIPGFHGYLSTRFFVEEHLWRDRTVFNYGLAEIKSLRLENAEKPDQSFVLKQGSGGSFELLDAKDNPYQAPEEAIKSYLDRFQNIHWEVMDMEIGEAEKDSILGSNGFYTMTLEPLSGDPVVIKTFRLANKAGKADFEGNVYPYDLDRMHALLNGKDFVYVQYATFDALYRELSQFIPAS